MILGTSLLTLMMLGAAQEPPSGSAAPGDMDFVMYKESVLDDWDLSDGSAKYAQCEGPHKSTMVTGENKYFVRYKTNGHWHTSPFYKTYGEACTWKNNHCVCGCG
jgi:hypothetical protein